MSEIPRKKHTGEPGNGGQFGSAGRLEGDTSLSLEAATAASTYTDLSNNADPGVPIARFVDDTTPAGYWGVTTKVLGIVRTYILRGELDDPDSPILFRTDIANNRATRYRGSNLLGGEYVGYREFDPQLDDPETRTARDTAPDTLEAGAPTDDTFRTKCPRCDRPTHYLAVFPGNLCPDCYEEAHSDDPLLSPQELARMWGGR